MEFYMRFPQGKAKALTLSYDDGVEQDVRLIDIMKKHGLKGTFNLNSGLYAAEDVKYPEGQIHRRMPKSKVDELYTDSGMEIAVHGYTHPWLEQLPVNIASYEIIEDRRTLEKQFSRIVRGMAYPYGTFNDAVVEMIKNAGICYSRTVHSTHNFEMPTDWLRLPATCHHNDHELMELLDRFLNDENCGKWSPKMFYLWGHSYEFEANDNWDVIEKFAEKAGGRDDIWYATNIEIYDYQDNFKRLQMATDFSRCYNPTAVTLWFKFEGKLYEVAPGETLVINA